MAKQTRPQYPTSISAFLQKRIGENSNLEMEWLWAADRVATAEERHYCVARALFINPTNQQTKRRFDELTSQLRQSQTGTNSQLPSHVPNWNKQLS